MSIPAYSLWRRSSLPAEYPPIASSAVSSPFQLEYVGDAQIEIRIRRALRKFTVTQLDFWKFPIAALVLGVGVYLASAIRMPPWATIVVVLVFLVAGSVAPVWILSGIRRTAQLYARKGEHYASSFSESRVLWKVDSSVFEVRFDQMSKLEKNDGVAIVGLRKSRAILVLPDEIFPEEVFRSIKDLIVSRKGETHHRDE